MVERAWVLKSLTLERMHPQFEVRQVGRFGEVRVDAMLVGAFKKIAQIHQDVCKHDVLHLLRVACCVRAGKPFTRGDGPLGFRSDTALISYVQGSP